MAAFLGLGLRALILLFRDREAPVVTRLMRIVGAIGYLAGFFALAVISRPFVGWSPRDIIMAAVALTAVLGTLVFLRPQAVRRVGWGAGILHVLALVILVVATTLTLLTSGFLSLFEDQPVLLVDITGETRAQVVRWEPPGGALREEPLEVHRVVFRDPGGEAVAEAWVYGDEVAVKGRVLRLAPWLNALGLPNLFELVFAHNGYTSVERHNAYPHQAVRVPPMGPLAVHPLWRPFQRRLLAAWERGFPEGSPWGVRAVTTESTFFPLVEGTGQASKGTYRLVLTSGGLTAG